MSGRVWDGFQRQASFIAILSLLAAVVPASARAQLAVRGGVVHPVEGPPIDDGVVLIGADGRIEAVGPAADVSIPDGYEILEAAVVTPGLVDARSVVGLSGILGGELPSDQDQLESSSAIQPELRAFDAYNARDPLVPWLRDLGTTTLHTGHGPGALISGQTMVVKTRGTTVDERSSILSRPSRVRSAARSPEAAGDGPVPVRVGSPCSGASFCAGARRWTG
jgi:imidazolonepropionase-like amidohydrolase